MCDEVSAAGLDDVAGLFFLFACSVRVELIHLKRTDLAILPARSFYFFTMRHKMIGVSVSQSVTFRDAPRIQFLRDIFEAIRSYASKKVDNRETAPYGRAFAA